MQKAYKHFYPAENRGLLDNILNSNALRDKIQDIAVKSVFSAVGIDTDDPIAPQVIDVIGDMSFLDNELGQQLITTAQGMVDPDVSLKNYIPEDLIIFFLLAEYGYFDWRSGRFYGHLSP